MFISVDSSNNSLALRLFLVSSKASRLEATGDRALRRAWRDCSDQAPSTTQ